MDKKLLDKTTSKRFVLTIERKYNNYKLILYACMLGLSLMFLSLTFLSLVSHFNLRQPTIKLPIIFYFNTLILIASSTCILIAQKNFRNDNYKQYKTSMWFVLAFGNIFLIGQVLGWYIMYENNFHLQNNTAAYIYVISGIHAFHIIGGLLFLIYFINNSRKTLKSYATSVVYFTDPIAKSQLQLFGIFWHFLGVIWLYLLFFFIAID